MDFGSHLAYTARSARQGRPHWQEKIDESEEAGEEIEEGQEDRADKTTDEALRGRVGRRLAGTDRQEATATVEKTDRRCGGLPCRRQPPFFAAGWRAEWGSGIARERRKR